MSTEEQRLPEHAVTDDPAFSAAMHVARQWKDVDAAHLQVALAAMEPSLKREHRERMMRMTMMKETEERQYAERQEKRQHTQYLVNLIVGGVVALAMLAGGVLVAPHYWWLSTLMCGPSLLALVKIFVLRRSDASDMTAVADATRRSTNAGAPPPVI
ncbi:hypothetical protein [Streptomyces sp. NRRL F-5635]|uniref:hypothetical protein n=1 Tax=Streptomyces sp. NRRL F-5635 TaxID=1463865 RepID=UPI0006913E43|nr:hypothetical protein [Streptomyces sp. NRRL F-5635]